MFIERRFLLHKYVLRSSLEARLDNRLGINASTAEFRCYRPVRGKERGDRLRNVLEVLGMQHGNAIAISLQILNWILAADLHPSTISFEFHNRCVGLLEEDVIACLTVAHIPEFNVVIVVRSFHSSS